MSDTASQMACAIAVIDIGSCDYHPYHQSKGIDQQMPLAPFHLLATIVFTSVFTSVFTIVAVSTD
jgi:hypothetical protein